MGVRVGYSSASALTVALDQAPVILGPVVFAGHEVPSRISIGGAHAVVIHRLPGGGRVMDAMGSDDGAIGWSGYFTGPIATTRARVVDAIRRAGETVGLSFGDYAFNVVVVHFEYVLQDRGALISYRIRMEIMPDVAAATNGTSVAIAASLSNDVAAAAAILPGFGLAGAQAALIELASAVALPGDPTSASNSAAVGFALGGSSSVLQNAIAACGAGLTATVLGGNPGLGSATALAGAVSQAGSLAAATQAAGYVNRSGNWANQLAGRPQSPPLILA